MYSEYFRLTELPFSLTPDPRYLFMSERHREGLAHLLYGIQQPGGFVQLTGEVGSGKTTLCRYLVSQLPPKTDVALILNPCLTVLELLAAICDELRVPYPSDTGSVKTLVDTLNQHLLEAHANGRRTVLIIDEAQNLQNDVLEQIRLLTNLETSRDKLLQIVLIGQPELLSVLRRKKLRQLAQRITVRYHLLALSRSETYAYVRHRLSVAGGGAHVFTGAALRKVYGLSGGVPRLINIICDRSLLGAYALDRKWVDAGIVRRASKETRGSGPRSWLRPVWHAGAGAIAVLAIGGVIFLTTANLSLLHKNPEVSPPQPQSYRSVGVSRSEQGTSGSGIAGTGLPTTGRENPGGADSASRSPQPRPGIPVEAGETATVKGQPASTVAATPRRLADILEDPSLCGTSSTSFSSLYTHLGIRIPATQTAIGCQVGREQGYDCIFKLGNWTKLRNFDLPAILELILPTGQRQRVTIVGLSADTATLEIGEREYSFPLREIDTMWDGSFIIVWKLPFSAGSVAPGARGEKVAWIRSTLDTLDGRAPSTPASDLFDSSLRQRVMAFQRDQSLPQDGVVGDMTLVRLTLALMGSEAPSISHHIR
jgi:general secretion pathway protein A